MMRRHAAAKGLAEFSSGDALSGRSARLASLAGLVVGNSNEELKIKTAQPEPSCPPAVGKDLARTHRQQSHAQPLTLSRPGSRGEPTRCNGWLASRLGVAKSTLGTGRARGTLSVHAFDSSRRWRFVAAHSNDEGPIEIGGRLNANVFDASLPISPRGDEITGWHATTQGAKGRFELAQPPEGANEAGAVQPVKDRSG
jgi:hypothetical protein